ncbi:MAG: histidine kinase [Cyclobacteriaceae bacterium]|nr:histidine kinase [Cyclobacteriaceae bacterium]
MVKFWVAFTNFFSDLYNKVPNKWKSAYIIICGWYLINYSVSAFFQWKLFEAYDYNVFWNTLYLYELLCVAVLFIFLWARWLFKFKVVFQVAGHFMGLLAFTLFMETTFYYFDMYLDGFDEFEDWQQYMIDLLSWDAMRFYDQYIITAAVFYVIRYFDSLQKKESERSVLLIKNKEMQLTLLKSQINPHFLFNTLNSISMLISTSKDKARKVITQLSDVFRYALDSYGGYTVKLSSEIEFIENYIKIQQVRFEDRLKFEKEIAFSCLNLDVPPMILQPLIENSVKYGIAPKDNGGTIKLTVKPYKNGIFFEVRDNGLGINAKKVLDSTESTGIGLDNTDKRLKSFFGFTAGLHIDSSEDGYVVSFVLPEKYKNKIEDKMELYNLE